MNDWHEKISAVRMVHRDPLFDRTLAALRSQGGYAVVAAEKAGEFINILTGTASPGSRGRFRFTRKGEYRVPNCRKVDLGCGYRIVCIHKGERLVLLYIGTHDDCFRWLERHRTAEYDLDAVAQDAWISVKAESGETVLEHRHEDDRATDAHEEALLERIDDAVLRKVFAGIVQARA